MKPRSCRICGDRTTEGVHLSYRRKHLHRPTGGTRVYSETRAVCPACVEAIRDVDTMQKLDEAMAGWRERKGAA